MGLFRDFMDYFERRRYLRWTPPASERVPQQPETPEPDISDAAELRHGYTDEEREVVERYIGEAFGPIARTFYDVDGDRMPVDIAVTEPDAARRFYTLTTVGMGAHRMEVPEELAERNQAFAELTVCLPPEWDLMRDSWPFHMLKETARHPFAHRDLLSVGNAYHGAVMHGSDFDATFVIPAATRGTTSTRLMMPNGRIINFYLLLPLYEDEWDYIVSRKDSYSFWERYSERIGSVVVDPERESCIDGYEMEEGG